MGFGLIDAFERFVDESWGFGRRSAFPFGYGVQESIVSAIEAGKPVQVTKHKDGTLEYSVDGMKVLLRGFDLDDLGESEESEESEELEPISCCGACSESSRSKSVPEPKPCGCCKEKEEADESAEEKTGDVASSLKEMLHRKFEKHSEMVDSMLNAENYVAFYKEAVDEYMDFILDVCKFLGPDSESGGLYSDVFYSENKTRMDLVNRGRAVLNNMTFFKDHKDSFWKAIKTGKISGVVGGDK